MSYGHIALRRHSRATGRVKTRLISQHKKIISPRVQVDTEAPTRSNRRVPRVESPQALKIYAESGVNSLRIRRAAVAA